MLLLISVCSALGLVETSMCPHDGDDCSLQTSELTLESHHCTSWWSLEQPSTLILHPPHPDFQFPDGCLTGSTQKSMQDKIKRKIPSVAEQSELTYRLATIAWK